MGRGDKVFVSYKGTPIATPGHAQGGRNYERKQRFVSSMIGDKMAWIALGKLKIGETKTQRHPPIEDVLMSI